VTVGTGVTLGSVVGVGIGVGVGVSVGIGVGVMVGSAVGVGVGVGEGPGNGNDGAFGTGGTDGIVVGIGSALSALTYMAVLPNRATAIRLTVIRIMVRLFFMVPPPEAITFGSQ
jgi:hypothetical protein